jgi:hypothetical protein
VVIGGQRAGGVSGGMAIEDRRDVVGEGERRRCCSRWESFSEGSLFLGYSRWESEILSRGIGPLGPKQNFYPKHAKFLLVALASKRFVWRLGAHVHAMMRVSWSTSKMHLYTFFISQSLHSIVYVLSPSKLIDALFSKISEPHAKTCLHTLV